MSARRARLSGVLQAIGITVGLIGLVGGFVLLALQYRPYSVPTDSMVPTVQPGDVLLAHPVKGSRVGRGDVIVFKDPVWGTSAEVKRVIGVGGDTVACCDSKGRATVNGTPIDEPYLSSAGAPEVGATRFSSTVPAGRLFLMGDNRSVSLDSRSHLTDFGGTVPLSGVIARVEGTVWPLGRAGTIDRTSAFDSLPGPRATAHGPLAALCYAIIGGAALVLLTAAAGTVEGWMRKRRRS
ncbi:signal peptidase I [Streptacidiphilus sp. N1-12]|uniref:Signal peptidase I n=2 Tax=Streptacidiphilus alkalitolerans TaxID=3342712 RepID=A0ABV6VLH0_9ACTN